MNRAEVYATVRSFSERTSMSDAELATIREMLESELNLELRDHPRMRKRVIYTFTADGDYLSLPDDVFSLIRVSDTAGNKYRPVPDGEEDNQPRYTYYDYGNQLKVAPSKVTGDQMRIVYHGALDKLLLDTSENWVSRYFPLVYLYGMLKWLAIWTKDSENLAAWSKEYDKRLAQLKIQGWDQNLGTSASAEYPQ